MTLRTLIRNALAVTALVVFTGSTIEPALSQRIQTAPQEVLVKFRPTISTAQVQTTFSNANLQQVQLYNAIGVYLCRVSPNESVNDAVRACNADPSVEYAEPNYVYTTFPASPPRRVQPNDPRYNQLYAMENSNDADIDAPEAWDRNKGDRNVIVAVIDTGIDYDHEDLRDNMWKNPGETGGGKENNNIDDDGNGFVDDVYGWDFARNRNDPDDDNGHGTHCAGTVGAVGDNGKGVVGVNWTVSLMALKFLDSNGSGSTADAVGAIIYAADNGADVLSNSWGGGGYSRALEDAIKYARDRDAIFIAASGNAGQNNDFNNNYPSNYEVENVIAVAASNQADQVANFSNVGQKTVDLAAPGVDIASCQPSNRYQFLSGTSMATPHVAGVAGLILAQYPGLDYRQVAIRLMGSVDRKSEFSSLTVSGGRLNANQAIGTSPLIAFVTRKEDTLDTVGPYEIHAEAIDEGALGSVELTYALNGSSQQKVPMSLVSGNRYRGEIPGQPKDTQISYFVEATDGSSNTARSRILSFEIKEGGGCGSAFFTFSGSDSVFGKGLMTLLNFLAFTTIIWLIAARPWERNRRAA